MAGNHCNYYSFGVLLMAVLRIEEVKYAEFNKYADTGITPVSL